MYHSVVNIEVIRYICQFNSLNSICQLLSGINIGEYRDQQLPGKSVTLPIAPLSTALKLLKYTLPVQFVVTVYVFAQQLRLTSILLYEGVNAKEVFIVKKTPKKSSIIFFIFPLYHLNFLNIVYLQKMPFLFSSILV